MIIKGVVPTSIESIKWQDYRSTNTGMVIYYNTDPVSELPIREIPEELPTTILPDPHYETGTLGVYGCKHNKVRSTFAKSKMRYVFFMTRYSGTNIDFVDELLVTGFYRVKQTADVQKLHIRYLTDYSCLNDDNCIAFRADQVHFVAVENAFMLTPEVLKGWGCTSRITRQSKIVLDEEKTMELVAYLESKQSITPLYIEETERFLPAYEEELDEEEDEEDLFEDATESDYEEDKEEVPEVDLHDGDDTSALSIDVPAGYTEEGFLVEEPRQDDGDDEDNLIDTSDENLE